MVHTDVVSAEMSPPDSGERGVIFPAIIENMRDGVLALDGNGNIIAANRPLLDILQVGNVECIGQNFAELLLMHGDLEQINDAIVDAMYAPNNVVTRDVAIARRGGERHLVVRTSMLRDDGRQEVLGVVAIISDISAQVQALRERIEFGHLVVLFVALLGTANIVALLVDKHLPVNVYSSGFSWAYLGLIAVPVLFSVWRLKLPLASIGLTLQNWRRALVEGLSISALILAALYTYSQVKQGIEPTTAGQGAFGSAMAIGLAIAPYLPHSFVQELLARGVLQSSLMRLLNDQRGVRSLLVTSLIFGLFHSYFGVSAIAVTAASGLLFGWLFNRHGNLIGATLVHFIGGIAAFTLQFL
ncbi:CPBP family intramembrane metalloprotease [Agrobacterium sp. a22-2]|uniref:CPBP family intramembrane glutamic endopeptidase n=1 Tax=Agrobacterium sp. a22-2 TaxID=2283840 RepID=UPI00144515BD|nr:CPBP family intramembrane metalloprotease [Agrobacterium sp. a22-2]